MLEGDVNRELTTAREELRKLRDDLKVEQTKGGMFEAATRQVCVSSLGFGVWGFVGGGHATGVCIKFRG
jgi:hypothetical protein